MGPWSMSLYDVIKCVVPNVQHLTDCSSCEFWLTRLDL